MKKDNIKLSILWIFSFLVIIFMMTFKSLAAEPATLLPFYISDSAYDSVSFQSLIDDQINWWGRTVFDFDTFDTVLAYEYEEYGTTYVRFYGFSDSAYTITLNEPYNAFTSSGTVTLNLSSCSRYTITKVPGYYGNYSYGYDYPSNISIGFTDIENYPFIYLNNVLWTPSFNNVDGHIVFTNNASPIIPNGAAILPGPFIIPDYPTGTTAPDKVPPTYTPNNYTWTQKPTFDNSSTLSALESIGNLIDWLSDNLKNEISNLTDNLKGFFKYIGDTIQYYGNAIIETLNNAIQTFYNNMKSLIEPIFQKIDYITTPLQADVIWNNITGTSLITNYTSIMSAANTLKSSFENLSEPSEFKIPIHLEDLPSSWFGNLTTQYIDLGVINPVKSIIRTFMWALITYSLVVTIIDSIANYINGGGDES